MGLEDQLDETNPYEAPHAEDAVARTAATASKGIDLAVENPFLTIWIRPSATIRGIVDNNPYLYVIPLALAGGFVQALDQASQQNAGDTLTLSVILGLAIILGPIGGLFGLFVGGWLIGLTSYWLGGRAKPEQIRAAIAWSSVPVLATIPIWMIQIGLVGRQIFTQESPALNDNPAQGLVLMASAILEAFLGLWSFVILLKGVGEMQIFATWKALASVLLSSLLLLAPFVPAAIFIYYFS
jgi:uncharacterized membrane protein YGL010W